MPWQLEIPRRADKQLQEVPSPDKEAIEAKLALLRVDPSAVDLVKLGGTKDRWRLRIGRWRVIFRFDNRDGVMYVVDVLPRDQAYRD